MISKRTTMLIAILCLMTTQAQAIEKTIKSKAGVVHFKCNTVQNHMIKYNCKGFVEAKNENKCTYKPVVFDINTKNTILNKSFVNGVIKGKCINHFETMFSTKMRLYKLRSDSIK